MGKLRGIVLPAVESVHLAGAVLEEIGVEATKGETSLRSVRDPEAAKTDESATVTRTGTESIKADETAPEAIRTGEIDPKTDETDPNAAKGDKSGSEPNRVLSETLFLDRYKEEYDGQNLGDLGRSTTKTWVQQRKNVTGAKRICDLGEKWVY